MVNSKRPQTSYGGISARQKSLQKSLRQKSSKLPFNPQNKIEDLFPGPSGEVNSNYFGMNANSNFDLGLKNKLSKAKNFI
jgi:hypothetical protein